NAVSAQRRMRGVRAMQLARVLLFSSATHRVAEGRSSMKRMLVPLAAALVAALGFAPRLASAGPDDCFYKGTMYSERAQACQAGALFRCKGGDWKSQGTACTETAEQTASNRCDLSGISYPTGSASCQNGTQYRCEDGAWRSLGTACPGEVAVRVVPGDK